MLEILLEVGLDLLKTLPILFLAYLLAGFLEARINAVPNLLMQAERLGPLFGGVVGVIPQCGFSAASAALYARGFLAPATVVAVFLSTSDEALPILLAQPELIPAAGKLIVCKLVIAIAGGYLLRATVFRSETKAMEELPDEEIELDVGCDCTSVNLLGSTFWRTLTTAVYLFVCMLVIEVAFDFVGEDMIGGLLLNGSMLQPALCGLIGLIPGCAVSVFLTELFAGGSISFGAAIAGLCSGAGFGYLVMFSETRDKRAVWKVIAAVYVVAVIAGMLVDLIW
ncbi:MAG: putative manganese transporter [Butyricicoccaceae bacterium]